MSGHNHGDHCHDEAHDGHGHDHDHDDESTGPKDNLYQVIDMDNVVLLNVEDANPARVIKPWHKRMDEESWIESDSDDQIIIRIPFTGSVKLRSILLKAGPGDQTPAKMALFANDNTVDFSDISDKTPAQEVTVVQSRDIGEYAVKPAKFSNLNCLTIFIPASQGADTSRIYYIGLIGTWTMQKRDAVVAVYESQANIADHEKIQGTDGGFNQIRFGH